MVRSRVFPVVLLAVMAAQPTLSHDGSPRPWRGDASGLRVEGDSVVFVIAPGEPTDGPKARALSSLLTATRKDLRARGLSVTQSTADKYVWGDPPHGGRVLVTSQFVGVLFFSRTRGKQPEPHEVPTSREEILRAADLYFESR